MTELQSDESQLIEIMQVCRRIIDNNDITAIRASMLDTGTFDDITTRITNTILQDKSRRQQLVRENREVESHLDKECSRKREMTKSLHAFQPYVPKIDQNKRQKVNLPLSHLYGIYITEW